MDNGLNDGKTTSQTSKCQTYSGGTSIGFMMTGVNAFLGRNVVVMPSSGERLPCLRIATVFNLPW